MHWVAVYAAMAPMKGVFGGFDAFFALLRVVPELSASFLEPSMAKILCHRGSLAQFIGRC